MKLIIIAALNKKRVIGKNGKTPWHIPEDLQRFKQLTTHRTVLMGRKTFESIGKPALAGKPLPNRRNVVVSRNEKISNYIEIFSSIESALSHLQQEEKVYVIGGGEIFQQTLDRADEMLLTIVENDEDGDVFFPEYKHLIGTTFVLKKEEKRRGFSFLTYEKSPN